MNWWDKILFKISGWLLPKGWVISTFKEINEQENKNNGPHEVSCFCTPYRGFCGMETRLYMVPDGEPREETYSVDGKAVTLKRGAVGNVRAIDLRDKLSYFGGTMTFIVFDGLDEIEALRGKRMKIFFVAADEFGKVVTLLDKTIDFSRYYNWSINNVDLVTEATIDFTIVEDEG